MKLNVSEALPLPALEVFHLLRDDMPLLVPYLYDIERIDVIERSESADRVHIVNLWQGDLNRVPSAVRRFVSADLISWRDDAVWTTSTQTATWKLDPRVGARVFTCTGTTRVKPDGDRSRLDMDIDFEVYPERVPGVPSLLARKFRKPIEEAIAKQVRPNLVNLAGSIRRYAEAKR